MIAPARAGTGGARGCESNMSRPWRASTIRSMRRFRVGLGQINPTVGDFEGNVRRIVEGIERARALGCHLVAFPELAVPGYPPEDLLFKPAFIEANLRALDEVARASRGLTVVVGFVDRRDDIFNAAAILHDGERAGVYHKQYLPNYGVFDENRYFQSGTESPVFADIGGHRRLTLREDGRRGGGLEVAVLVEDTVVRQVLLVIGARVRAVVQHGRGVEAVVALVHKSEDR